MTNEKDKLAGRAIGAAARSKKLSPEERSAIARKAANARHHRYPVAIKKGNFRDDFGFDVDCYVLNDENKTAVISPRGMAEALALGEGGARLTRFVSYKYLEEHIGPDLREKFANPIVFQVNPQKNTGPGSHGHGYDVTILIDLCNAIISASSVGKKVPETTLKQARVIISASAKSGIQELVYRLSGFDSTKEQFISAFKAFVNEEAKKYEKEFPIELYEEWARLYQLQIPVRGWPWEFKRLTNEHIYYPLAKSQGRILTLMRISKSNGGDRRKKLFQFLNDIGTRALRMQLGRILEMAESSESRLEYERKFADRFGDQIPLPLDKPEA